MEDQRFKSLVKDPRCRDIPKNVRKVKVDKRFQKMLKHKQFKGNNRIDERGRNVNFSTSEKLKKLYNLKDSSEEGDSSSENSEDEQEEFKGENASPSKIKKDGMSKKDKPFDVLESDGKNLQDKKSKHLKKEKTITPKLIRDLSENASSDDNTDSSEEDGSVNSEDESKNLKSNSVTTERNKKLSQKQKVKNKNLKSKKSDLLDGKLSDASTEEDSSDSDDSDDSDSAADIFADRDEFDHNWEEWHEQAPDTDQIFKRLAVCNMDWDRIRADDLFTVFNSFKPAGGTVNSVKIYPSEFGLKRMEAERLKGPPELVEESLDPEAEEKQDKKKAKFHREKLREYQLKRLQYYYAVVDCDSPETADHLYVELNGKEYESSSVRFDLRFIPDDTTFDHEPVSEASKVLDPSEYRPRYFVSSALGQAKVDLTWDETDPQRQEVLERAFKEPDNIEKDIKDYLASSSGESEEEQADNFPEDKKLKLNERISKYKELLQSLEEKGKEEEEKYDMEISWQPDLKEKTEKLVKQKLEEHQNPFDEMIKKKKEERKLKKQQKNTINKDEEGSNSESDEDYSDTSADEKSAKESNKKLDELYLISDSKKALDQTQEKSSKKKKKKNKQKKNEPEITQDFKFVEDERFSAIYTSPEFNLDPSDPHFKKTDGNLAFIQEKQRRLKTKTSSIDDNRKNKKAKYW